MTLYSFGTESRIRCAADYKSVFDGALFKVHQPHFLFLAKLTEQPKSRLGIVVAKKKVRRELHQQLDFAWQKLQRLAKKHSKVVVAPLQN